MQSDMQRMADSYLAILGRLNETSLMFFDTARTWGARAPGRREPRDPRCGTRGAVQCPDVAAQHDTSAVAKVRPWTRRLVSHAGARLPVGGGDLYPEADRPAGCGWEPGDPGHDRPRGRADPGPYHGQILVEGLPDAAFPLTVRVLPRARRVVAGDDDEPSTSLARYGGIVSQGVVPAGGVGAQQRVSGRPGDGLSPSPGKGAPPEPVPGHL